MGPIVVPVPGFILGTLLLSRRFSSTTFQLGRMHMFTKTMTAMLLGSTLLATAAFAQTSPPTAPATSTPPAAMNSTAPATPAAMDSSSYQGDWRTSKLVGVNVYNDSNESLGSINDLLLNKEGQVQAVVIGVGGFLGVGERNVAIPYAKVKFVDEPVKTTTASTNTAPATKTAPATGTASTTGAATGTAATTTTTTTKNPWYPDHAVISATKDQLKSMTEFKYSN